MPAPRRATLPLLLSLAVLLLLAVLAARGRSAVPRGQGLVIHGALTTRPRPTQTAVPLGLGHKVINPALGIGLSTIIAIALVAFLFTGTMVLVLVAMTRVRRRRRDSDAKVNRGEPSNGSDAEMVLTLLRGTRSALALLRQRAGGPPSDAVQAAWLALEEAAAECGTTRRPHQTPTEFTSAVLAEHDVDQAALATLRGLYQRVRFGRADSVTEADADAAVAALERIADALAAGRVEVGPA
ncbi:MAG TPA: DUF4129 domain-containing protein [Pseudonocardiaceae bacterium]|nr:DUF4129 domain-containing protein [Pseudonocardiaceae bacterium]